MACWTDGGQREWVDCSHRRYQRRLQAGVEGRGERRFMVMGTIMNSPGLAAFTNRTATGCVDPAARFLPLVPRQRSHPP